MKTDILTFDNGKEGIAAANKTASELENHFEKNYKYDPVKITTILIEDAK